MDNGIFQLNDIVLDIPPESIRVDRKSYNNQWQTLRTRSSIKVKSGFSSLDIYISCKFTDDNFIEEGQKRPRNGLKKLRDLISQFRVTPFCFVENQFIRSTVLGGESTMNMALALKNIEIMKGNDSTNVVSVNMLFSWFNYFPYTRTFTYKEDIFSPVEVKNPADSRAWKLMYKAEQARNLYLEIDRLDPSFSTVLGFNQFAQITKKKYGQLQKEVEALAKLRAELIATPANDGTDVDNANLTRQIRQTLIDELKSDDWANAVINDVFGHTTTMYTSNDPIGDALDLLDRNIDPGTSSTYGIIVDSDKWQPIILADRKAVILKSDLARQKPYNEEDEEKFDNDDNLILLGRQRDLNLNSNGLIVTGISISFENILATMPVIGHPYPSYQHIGSTDARISMSIVTTSEESVKSLSGFYSIIEEQAHKYRMVPAGHRNVSVSNPLINMCGLQDMIPETLVIETVPGSPGTYAAELVLIDNPLNSETAELFTPSGSFNNPNAVRKKIVEVIQKKLKLINDPFVRSSGFLTKTNALTLRNLQDGGLFENNSEPAYYVYTGDGNDRSKAFKDLCIEYGKELGKLLEQVFPQLANLQEFPQNAAQLGFRPEDFFQLTGDDVIGIEKLQEDIRPTITSLKPQTNTHPLLGDLGVGSTSGLIEGARAAATASFFDTYNRLNEAKQSSVLSESGREETINEVFVELDLMRNDQRMSLLMNKLMMDYIAFVVEFTDRIRLSGFIEDLDEFAEIRDFIRETPISSASLSYSDFPLTEVLSIMSQSTDPGLKSAYSKLKKLFDSSGLSEKSINMASLINPDFYFFNPQNDLIKELVPRNIIDSARESIKAARQSQEQVEGDWFKNVYDKSVISAEKSSKVYVQVGQYDKQLTEQKDPGIKQSIANYLSRLNLTKAIGFAPPDLIGSVGPSIEESRANQNGDKPITLTELRVDNDQDNIYTNYRPQTILRGPKSSSKVKHRFDTNDCLDYLPEHAYATPIVTRDPGTLPTVEWPTYANIRRVTSDYGPRTPPTPRSSTFHRGIDLAGAVAGTCDGAPVLAAADGTITFISYSATERSPGSLNGGEGVQIQIGHTGGLVTKYFHLKWDDITSELSDIFHRKGKGSVLSEEGRNTALTVRRGDRIASIGNTGIGTSSHLHFETWINGTSENPQRVLDGDFNPSRSVAVGIDPNNESLLKKSIDQLEKELKTGQGYGMNRAYPAFKLYFIESDMGERKRYQFDDFFSYSSVKEIQVIRSRKIAADLCVIQLTNISGVLSNRKFQSAIDPTSAKDIRGTPAEEIAGSPERTNTSLENPIASLMLQPGIQIQLRLGYSNNPEELETLFNGVITDVEFAENDDLVQITCQSYAIELVQTIQGEVKNFGGFLGGIISGDSRTEVILNELLAAPEVVHFGRWEGQAIGNHQNTSLIANSLSNKWKAVPTPQDDNLFPPQGPALSWFKALVNSTRYVMYNTTIWDVFQEMTMRHPNYVASTVPYEGREGPRMTMFFGLPDQLYFSRDPSGKEENVVNTLKKIIEEGKEIDGDSANLLSQVLSTSSNPGAGVFIEGLELTQDNKIVQQRQEWFKALARQYATDRSYIKPFRNYHVVTSSLHILKNSISSSGHNTFNTATIQYSNKSPSVDEDTGELNFGNLKTFTLVGDAAIRDEEKREVLAQYPNCVGDEQAKRYAMSVLYQSFKDAYKGTVEIIGNPKIKPYDVTYIFDEYTDMFGPIEVEQVVHRISQQSGFVTEITPDLMVHVNQWATLSTSDAMGLLAESALKSIGLQSLGSIVGSQSTPLANRIDNLGVPTGVASIAASTVGFALNPLGSLFFNGSETSLGIDGSSSPFGFAGVFVFSKLITRTQLAHPFRFSPLVMGAKPMVGGLPNRRTDGTFIQVGGKWIKEYADGLPLLVEDVRDRMSPNNWIGYLGQGDLKKSLLR